MDFQKEFPQNNEIVYFNHAAVAPWPKRTQQAVTEFAQENTFFGATHYPNWLQTEHNLRVQLKDLIGATSTDEIALLKSTSEGLSVIAYGLDWSDGDEIIISNEEFPSNRIVWESLAQFGVSVRVANITEHDPIKAIQSQITDNTKLISISSVQYASGRTTDLSSLSKLAKQHGVLLCVDAIQSLGVKPFSLTEIDADFVVADGHKWMLGPEGLALFYCKQELLNRLKIHQYGWHMIENAGDYTTNEWSIAKTAKRFECGSPNMLGTHALNASLSLIHEVGLTTIESLTLKTTNYLRERIQENNKLELITDINQPTAITTFSIIDQDDASIQKQLMKKGLICAYRGGGIRFSPHFYQGKKEVDKAMAIVADTIEG
ncbi:aminotransferase class V-fold PLP-dependent enzyme [Bermanella marisrubri]|uniref:Aminotransferase, class V n=1 Tax=Bermanella marisrubri TaxID=207949 RepID=Q1N4L9_9GAMM|nr:aminotransferase class V-fold PLP-dependent enzyme [Bermanella marisrubri]EAT13409.1 Aminotransferase, class V [Oceanobacter sp. RED65] [Bermanella marisrubri]QIZ84159.1 aminotransferase class V-fold PLP-dependent enzyme [Bermanella marisrubri]